MTYYPDDYEDDPEFGDAPEWQPHTGQCDHCGGSTEPIGPFGLVCACAIGEGAAPGDCVCGGDE